MLPFRYPFTKSALGGSFSFQITKLWPKPPTHWLWDQSTSCDYEICTQKLLDLLFVDPQKIIVHRIIDFRENSATDYKFHQYKLGELYYCETQYSRDCTGVQSSWRRRCCGDRGHWQWLVQTIVLNQLMEWGSWAEWVEWVLRRLKTKRNYIIIVFTAACRGLLITIIILQYFVSAGNGVPVAVRRWRRHSTSFGNQEVWQKRCSKYRFDKK